jgi:streptogramin lyase
MMRTFLSRFARLMAPTTVRSTFGIYILVAGGCSAPEPALTTSASTGLLQHVNARGGGGLWQSFEVGGYLAGIVREKNGNFWVSDGVRTTKISRVTPGGHVMSYSIGYQPGEMAVDRAENLWLTSEVTVAVIIRVTRGLEVTTYPLHDYTYGAGIMVGQDRNIWFYEASHIGKLTPTGELTEYPAGQTNPYSGLAWAPDGLIFYRQDYSLASLNPKNGAIKIYDAPMLDSGGAIVVTSDDALWYTLPNPPRLVRFDIKQNRAATYHAPKNFLPSAAPGNLILAPDGMLWYTTQYIGGNPRQVIGGGLVRFDPSTKKFTPYPTPKGYDWLWDLVAGPKGTIWATGGSAVVELVPE